MPDSAKIHDVFHISQLKAFHGTLPAATHIPVWFHGNTGDTRVAPEAIIDRRMIKQQNHAVVEYLVKWSGYAAADATWEKADEFHKKFPEFKT